MPPIIQVSDPASTFSHKLLVVMVLSVLLATVTYYIIEIPCAKLKKYQSEIKEIKEI